MKRLVLAAAMSTAALGFSTASALADYTLNILHFNDWHSRIESINKYESTCSAEDEAKGACIGGAARLKTAIDQERAKLAGQNVILLDAGDNFQGSLFFTTYKGAVEAEFTKLFKVDAMTVGNHEFDLGEEGLAGFLDKVDFPVLGANVVAGHSAKIGDRLKPYVVLDVGGQKIGIVGAVTNDADTISSPGPNVLITDDVAALTAAVGELKKEGVNKIIALTHVGYNRDLSAIAKIPDIDVVVGGHSHTLLSNTDDKAAGPYPTFADNPGGYKVPVVTAASYSKLLGELAVTFDDNGVVTSAKGDPIPLDAKITPDPAVLARVKELAGPIEEAMAKPVAEAAAAIDGSRETCRAQECSMGDLVTDAMLDRTKNQGVTIAITNGGGLRASIDAGQVTMGDVVAVLPFQNTLATFQLSGKDIVASLENGVSQISDGAGRFAQVAGLRYSFDRSVGPNSGRIKSVEVREGDGWKPIDPDATYTLASNNFMRAGGDGYALFRDNAKNAYDYGPGLETVLADYLEAHQPYKPYTDGRIEDVTPKVVNSAKESAPAPETAQAAQEAKMPDLPAQSMSIASQPPKIGGEAPAAKVEVVPAAPAEIKVPDLPANSMKLATQPPAVPHEEAPKAAEAASQPAATAAAAPSATAADAADDAVKGAHVVVAGDNYWNLAKAIYGDASLWRKIAGANPHQKPDRLLVGTTLKIPPK